jgi:DNA repair exonuclease SbcCD ATPase subunit
MGYALKIYEAFREDGEEKARILAEAFEDLENRFPQILEIATKKDLADTELKLIKEIEEVRKEIKEIELKLTKEIEEVRLEVEEVRKEIKELELKLTKEIEQVRFSTVKWITGIIIGQTVILITTFFTLLKLFLH